MQKAHTKNIINPSITIDSLADLTNTIVKILEENYEDIQTKIINKRFNTDDKQNFKAFVLAQYKIKQNQIDNISKLVLNFIASLEETAQQISYRDNKIIQLRKSLELSTDFILNLQDENDRYKQKIREAETYIDWIEEQKQFIDLLSLSGQKTLEKCKSEKRIFFNQKIQEESYLQKSRKKQRVDYSKLKQFITDLKQQKNSLIKQYNALFQKYNLKKKQCQKINLLFTQISEKYNGSEKSTQQCFKNNISASESINEIFSYKNYVKQFLWKMDRSSCAYSQQQVTKSANIKDIKNTKKYKYQQFQFDSQEKSFQKQSKNYKQSNSHKNVGTNTKIFSSCDKSSQYQQNLFISSNKKQFQLISRISSASCIAQKQVTSTKPNSQFDCQISISIKGNNKNLILNRQLSKFIDLNCLLQKRQMGFTKCKKLNLNGGKNIQQSKPTSQKLKLKLKLKKNCVEESNLCNHLYCYFTNKIVDDRIKKYKYIKEKGKK